MAKGGSGAAIAEQKKSRQQANRFNMLALKSSEAQFKESMKMQKAQAAEMSRLARVAPQGSETSRDMAAAATEIAREAAKRTSFSKFRFA